MDDTKNSPLEHLIIEKLLKQYYRLYRQLRHDKLVGSPERNISAEQNNKVGWFGSGFDNFRIE